MTTIVDPAALADIESWREGPRHDLFDGLRLHGPVVWIPGTWGTNGAPGGGYWAAIGHAEASLVGRTPEIFTSTMGAAYPTFAEDLETWPDNITVQDAPTHTALRAYAWRPFTPKVVSRFDEWVRNVVVECVNGLAGARRFDGVSDVAEIIPARVICDLLGVPAQDRSNVLVWTVDIFARDTPEGLERAQRGVKSLLTYAMELRERKRREPGVDVVSELLAAEAEGMTSTDAQYCELVMALLAAGYETTHTLIAQSLRMIAENSDIGSEAKACVSEGNAKLATEEFLRMITPTMNMARFAKVDTELGGRKIRAGQMVTMWFVAANRDPRVFSDPHRFIATRTPNNHLAFGAPGSPHYCLAHSLGRLQGRIFLEEFLRRDITIVPSGQVEYKGGTLINALKQLPLAVF